MTSSSCAVPSVTRRWHRCLQNCCATLNPATGDILATIPIAEDARDIVIARTGTIFVSEFRTGRVTRLPIRTTGEAAEAYPSPSTLLKTRVAWRMIAGPDEILPTMVSQEMNDPKPSPQTGQSAYGSSSQQSDPCSHGVVATTVQVVGRDRAALVPWAVLPIDIASNGTNVSILGAGNSHTPGLAQVFTLQDAEIGSAPLTGSGNCAQGADRRAIEGQAIALAYASPDLLVVQSREPAGLHLLASDGSTMVINLGGQSVEDVGHAVFHSNSGGRVACASCHAEGGDDGRVWHFPEDGTRRTPSLLGTVKGTAPYHWAGDQKDIRTLTTAIYEVRMQGPRLATEVPGLQSWLESLPAPIAYGSSDLPASVRGKAQFEARCTNCHSGSTFTNNGAYAVRFNGDDALQVPSLIGLSVRAPYMHDGCAPTLESRLDGSANCGGANHGNLVGLDDEAKRDLVTYLRSL
jgi:hypothetical protein